MIHGNYTEWASDYHLRHLYDETRQIRVAKFNRKADAGV